MAVGTLVAAFFVGLLWQKFFWMVWIFTAFAAQKLYRKSIPSVVELRNSQSFNS
jgi:hypothetical protein